MPIRFVCVKPELVLEHQGVKVWRAYLDDDVENPETYCFTTNPRDTDSISTRGDCFDVRLLEVPSARKLTTDHPPRITPRRGMSLRAYMGTPEYLTQAATWEKWWDEDQPRLIRQALIEAIEAGILHA